MSNWYSKKHAIVKRILCVCLAAVMVLSNMYVQNGSRVYAAAPETQATAFGGSVIRGVVNEITDLPHGGEDNANIEAERGTVRHPFVILEIVGYKEQAEIGYLVGGCEPIRVDELFGSNLLKYSSITGLETGIVKKTAHGEVFFFSDEKEGDLSYYEIMTSDNYASRKVAEEKTVNGYWEYVGDATEHGLFDAEETRVGTHVMVADEETRTVSMESDYDNGVFVWHTVNDIEVENNTKEYASITFKDVLDISKTYRKGDRIYTTRSNTDGNILYNMGGDEGYAFYKNKEILLTESLGLTEKEAIGYSVVVKTITTEELNNTPEWVDYADLIYINPVSKNENIPVIFKSQVSGKNVNSLGLTGSDFSATYKSNIFEENDLDFSVVRRIFYKVSAEQDFAALIMDSDLYNLGASYSDYYSDATKKDVQVDVFDWNLNQITAPSYPSEETAELNVASAEETSETYVEWGEMLQTMNVSLAGRSVTKQTHVFETDGLIDPEAFFNINSGSIKSNRASKTYNGVTYTKCYELASSASISVTAGSNGGELTLVFGDASKNVYVTAGGGTKTNYNLDTSTQVFTMHLEADTTYVFSKNGTAYIYYMEYIENGSDSTEATEATEESTEATEETTEATEESSEVAGTTTSGMVHNFTTNGVSSTFYSFSVSKESDLVNVSRSYNGMTFTKGMSFSGNSDKITFTAEKAGTLTIVVSDTASKKINIDGSGKSSGSNGVLTIDLEAGSHTISKNNITEVCYVAFEYDESMVSTEPTEESIESTEPTEESTEPTEESTEVSSEPSLGEGGMVHNFTTDGIKEGFYKFTGNSKNLTDSEWTYGGLDFTRALKIESKTVIEFTAAEKGTLTLVTSRKDNKSIYIDGIAYTTADDGSVKVTLEAGAHKITKCDTMNMYYMSFVYGEILPDAGTSTESSEDSSETSSESGSEGGGATSGNHIHNFTKNDLNSTFYKFTGSLSEKSQTTFNYDGTELLLTQSLKLNSKGSVVFKAGGNGALTLVFDDTSNGKSILINGKAYQINSRSIEVNIVDGTTYTIKQVSGEESLLFFVAVEYGKSVEEDAGGGTVNPVEPSTDAFTVHAIGSNNNIYKLCMMLTSINPNLVKQIWFRNNYITGDGTNLLQTKDSDAATYWSGATFKLARADMNNTTLDRSYYRYAPADGSVDLYDDWNSVDSFNQFGWHETVNVEYQGHSYRAYVSNHVYAMDDSENGGLGLAKYFGKASVTTKADVDYFKKFDEFVKDNYDANEMPEGVTDITGENAKPSYAVRYVLDLNASTLTSTSTLQVLDIEPTVSINSKLQQQWELQKSYVYMLVPDFAGNVEITHQTTVEFNSKSEDLNSSYDLIYLGTDYSGYNTKYGQMVCNASPITTVNDYFTDFNDNSMDGLIYFHLGDRMTSTEYKMMESKNDIKYIERDRSTQFLVDTNGNQINSTELRFPGNDISDLKTAELEVYLKAGKPIVADKFLHAGDSDFVQQNCNVANLVANYKTTRDAENNYVYKGLYSITETEQINEKVKENDVLIIYNELPNLYDGTTESDTSAELANEDVYLPVNASTGRAYLHFDFTVYQKNYGYRIYVDQDRNGKFEDTEVIVMGNVQNSKPTTYTYPLALSMVGLVQWKLEVYSKANQDVHQVITGCSAVKLKNDTDKQKINILQILPNPGDQEDNKLLDLEGNSLFKRYINKLEHYSVDITSITLEEFNKCFEDTNFDFDMSRDISIGSGDSYNPNSDVLQAVEAKKVKDNSGDEHTIGSFNMIIIGFQDTYGEKDLDNTHGAVEYLQYYTLSGKSILYTHDLTSLYNLKAQKVDDGEIVSTNTFGTTANTLLRDLMGMNRYGALSNQLTDRGMSLSQMIGFQDKVNHDDIASNAKHGYTYWALRHYGWTEDYSTDIPDERMPFAAMIKVPGAEKYVTQFSSYSKDDSEKKAWQQHFEESGFNNSNEITTVVKQMNKGQITEYPYKIDETMTIEETHAQSYQLNLEDPEVTVWYCLAGVENGKTSTSEIADSGTSVAYAANPMDGANNYYIYSKGNIFYSGVGHSEIKKHGEAKLFVNTMIAAYRTAYEAAAVDILSPGVIESGATEYTLQIPREYDNSAAGTADDQYTKEEFAAGSTAEVIFSPKNYNFRNVMDCCIYYAGANEYITQIYYFDDNNQKVYLNATAGNSYYFQDLMQGVEYYFDYPKAYLDAGKRQIEFRITYDGATEEGHTTLNMSIQPLFQLD